MKRVKITIEVDVSEDWFSKDDLAWSLQNFSDRFREIYIRRNRELDTMSIVTPSNDRIGWMECTVTKGDD